VITRHPFKISAQASICCDLAEELGFTKLLYQNAKKKKKCGQENRILKTIGQ